MTLEPVVAGFLFTLGLITAAAAIVAKPMARRSEAGGAAMPAKRREAAGARRRPDSQLIVQAAATSAGAGIGYVATGLWGMAVLLGGFGALLPPFFTAPRRRRAQTREALAWQLWTRQLAELTRSGAGLTESLRGSTEHAPRELADTVRRVASTAETRGIDEALDELAAAGVVWEPEVAVGLRMAASSGGPLTSPLLELCNRIGDVVSLHRSRTEAVVQLWTQTIALLALSSGVVTLMYRNNPAYFGPYRTSTGQLVLTLIAFVLLGSTAFLVYHSVVRSERSILLPSARRRSVREPL